MLHLKSQSAARGRIPRRRLLLFLIVATLPLIPAAFLNDYLDPLFYDTFFIGFALIATGFLLLAADRFGHGNKTEKAMTLSDALYDWSCADDRGCAGLILFRDDDLRRDAARI